jgi:hypothetical protein
MEMPPPRIVREPLTRSELVAIASEQFGDMVKAVVDVERKIMALGGELHSDEERYSLMTGHRSATCGASIFIRQRTRRTGSNTIR